MTFLAGSFPIVVNIWLGRRRDRRKRRKKLEEKARKIAQDFMKSRIPCNRGQWNYRKVFYVTSDDSYFIFFQSSSSTMFHFNCSLFVL